ncbi:MAG: hypothetical protein KDD58_13700 [Bdellovibrionales bacterium]|nr:hypothetical protein [Bdellovibrionales bacterium]
MFLIEVCKALKAKRVSYAVVGGYAVALHGAVRGTVDIDIVVKISEKSFISAEAALKSIGLTPRLPVTGKEVFLFREEYISNRNLIAWSFVDQKDPTKVVDIILTEDLSDLKTKVIPVGKEKLRILDIDDLIRMKKKSGRKQDLEDIKALELLK